jgi:hypothetical protein
LSHLAPNTAYVGGDYPQAWPLPPLQKVYLSLENSAHYEFDTPLGIAEWNATLPLGGVTVRLGPDRRPFTLGLFHRLRCLNIIREVLSDFYADASPTAKITRPDLVQHCMNHLRQMTLCSADLRLESLRKPGGNRVTVPEVTHTCKDWGAVYEAAEQNHQEYVYKGSK